MNAADFYTVLPFPYEGFACFNLLDESYAQSITMALLGQPPRDDLPPVSLQGLRLELLGDGPVMDFSLTPFGIPVVSEHAAAVLAQAGLANALLPATVDNAAAAAGRFSVLNVPERVGCSDEKHPGRVMSGEFGCLEVAQPRPNAEQARGRDLFRLDDGAGTLVMSERLRLMLECAGVVGPAMLSVEDEERLLRPGFPGE